MSNKWGVKPEQAEVIMELEKLIDFKIPIYFREISWDTFGVKTEEDNIIGLGLYKCELASLPDLIKKLDFLQELLICNNLTNPEKIGDLKSLQKLILNKIELETLPDSIGHLKSLQTLELYRNKLTTLPESIGNLRSLQTLLLGGNKLTTLPDSIGHLESLQTLELFGNELTTLPESIGNLKSLQTLLLSGNKLTTLPESIGHLKLLKFLNLGNNELTILPESIGNLSSLQHLLLHKNNLISLPDSVGNLKSLQKLELSNNILENLPESIIKLVSLRELNLEKNFFLSKLQVSLWQLNNLEIIKLERSAYWEGEWKELVKRDAVTLRKILKQKVSINIFISHTVSEFAEYRIKDLAEYLEYQPEVNQVYFSEEDLKGNIDAWMTETVPKSHLLLFVGTQQSKFSKDCSEELRLARVHNIPIIPIKGVDIDWKELELIGLSRELGFEFKKDDFDELCKKIYQYIYEFKRKRDLISKEHIIDTITVDSKLRIGSLIKEHLASEALNEIFRDRIFEIVSLEKEFKSNKISFIEFMKKLIDKLE